MINNNKESYINPKITLATGLENFESTFFTSTKSNDLRVDYLIRYLHRFKNREEVLHSYLSKYCRQIHLNLSENKDKLSHSDVFTLLIHECNNLTAKDLLDEKIMININEKYEFNLIGTHKQLSIMDEFEKTRGFLYYDHFDGEHPIFTLTFDSSKIIKMKNDFIFRISLNVDRDVRSFNEILLHSQPIPHLKEMSMLPFKKSNNYVLLVTKTQRLHLEPPYGKCSHYRWHTERPFNTLSHMQCYRHCLRSFAQNNDRINCTPLFIDNFISQLDSFTEQNFLCTYQKKLIFNELVNRQNISKKCLDLCPNDCLTVDYSYEIQRIDSEMDYLLETSNRSEVSLVWDSRQPMLSYIEESILSFTDYLVNCGGLLGIWFGINANDLFIRLIRSKFSQNLGLGINLLSNLFVRYVSNK